MQPTPVLLTEIRAHAARAAPREACGVVTVERGKAVYRPCRNVAGADDEFDIAPEDWAAAEDAGEIVAVVHSHPGAAPEPSMADRAGCEASGLPWWIVNHPVGHWRCLEPSGWKAPLVGREFRHGVLDCYTLVRDYYREVVGLEIPDFARRERWWERGDNLYLDYYREAGFDDVAGGLSAVRPHDVILMQVQSPVPNHAAIYLGDNLVLQHLQGRLSSRDVYGGYWQKCTRLVIRHRAT